MQRIVIMDRTSLADDEELTGFGGYPRLVSSFYEKNVILKNLRQTKN